MQRAANSRSLAWASGPGGEPEYFNVPCLVYFGLNPEEAAGWQWQWAVHPGDLPLVRRAWSRALRTGETCCAKFRLRRVDGVYRWHLFSSIPLCENARVLGWLSTCDDCTRSEAGAALELECACT
jgi:PAS domain S-box-containing protein